MLLFICLFVCIVTGDVIQSVAVHLYVKMERERTLKN